MKKTTKSAFHRGFTLIELMIVIVILGILMGTILPRLTGAQARARDTGRIADLNTIAGALETYFDDNGQYPGTPGEIYCLSDAASSAGGAVAGTSVLSDLGSYLKGGIVPSPAESQQTRFLAADYCEGAYVYASVQNRGIAGNGYVLITDVETFQKANALANDANVTTATPPTENIGDVLSDMANADTSSIADSVEETTQAAIEEEDENGGAGNTIYVLYN